MRHPGKTLDAYVSVEASLDADILVDMLARQNDGDGYAGAGRRRRLCTGEERLKIE